MAKNLHTQINKGNTLQSMLNTYSTSNQKAYAKFVSDKTGIAVTQLLKKEDIPALMKAMASFEAGKTDPFSQAVLDAGYKSYLSDVEGNKAPLISNLQQAIGNVPFTTLQDSITIPIDNFSISDDNKVTKPLDYKVAGTDFVTTMEDTGEGLVRGVYGGVLSTFDLGNDLTNFIGITDTNVLGEFIKENQEAISAKGLEGEALLGSLIGIGGPVGAAAKKAIASGYRAYKYSNRSDIRKAANDKRFTDKIEAANKFDDTRKAVNSAKARQAEEIAGSDATYAKLLREEEFQRMLRNNSDNFTAAEKRKITAILKKFN
jgi:hypothetical protein